MSWWNDFTRPIVGWLTVALIPYKTIPASTIFVVVMSTVISIIVSVVNRMVIDVSKLREYRTEVNAYMKDLNLARESSDRKLESRLKRRQAKVNQLQSWMMKQQLKLMAIFMIPFGVLFPLLSEVYTGLVIAYSPVSLPYLPREMGFVHWYLICSFGINLPLSRVFGISFGGEE